VMCLCVRGRNEESKKDKHRGDLRDINQKERTGNGTDRLFTEL
jgi:hypothetical protein